jgi:hypothetical protein
VQFSASLPNLRLSQPAQALLAENVNNQGCGAPQLLDFHLQLSLQSQEATSIVLDEGSAVLEIDGQAYPMGRQAYEIGGEKHQVPFRRFQLNPKSSVRFVLFSYAFAPKSVLDTADQLVVRIPAGNGEIRASFGKLKQISRRPISSVDRGR